MNLYSCCLLLTFVRKYVITAADVFHDRVLPFFEEQQIPLRQILADRGTEYNGKVKYGPH